LLSTYYDFSVHFGKYGKNGNNPIYVISPTVAKVRKITVAVAISFAQNFANVNIA
jgi:hypothetical protein